ncbi:MAG: alpha/beta hydrolase [Actinobacteria bacterium]|nr:alpha/beta hydrolase [Actinomycetota bacterium]
MASAPKVSLKLPANIPFPRLSLPWGGSASLDGNTEDRTGDAASSRSTSRAISWREAEMEEGVFSYADAGKGLPVLFLHGWGVSHRTYKSAIASLASIGCRVLAPAQPGFGGSPRLAAGERSFPVYAEWAARFLDAAGQKDPVTVIGHSFGGGVAIQVAHDFPEMVRLAILCNPVGGPIRCGADGEIELMSRRPLWEWGQELGTDLIAGSSVAKVLPAVAEGAMPNLLRNLPEVVKMVNVVRRANLLAELERVSLAGTPVSIVWSDRDRLVPHGAVTGLCRAAGVQSTVVEGSHTWLIAEPEMFAEVVLRVLVDHGVDLELFSGDLGDIIGDTLH